MSELVSPASIASWPEPGAEMPASNLGEARLAKGGGIEQHHTASGS